MASNKLHQNDQQKNSEWRYGLDDKASHTITLPDGRKLGYTDHGSPTGDAILYQHGLPGSRLEAESYHELAVELGARVIGIDRPGMGLSSPCPSRTVRDWAQDVGHLTEQLGLKTYSVLGVSGGGPYALSCAFGLPAEKLKCVSIVCGLGSPDMSMWNADWMHWLGFPYGWRYAPVWMLNAFFRLDEFGRMDLSDDERLRRVLDPKWLAKIKYPKDKVIYGDESVMRLSLRATREANRQGFEGIARDGKTACSDWGFKIENIRKDLPVKLWYGKDDRFIPANHGMEIAKRLGGEGGKVVLRLEDDSHFSISRNWRREQFEEILKEMRG